MPTEIDQIQYDALWDSIEDNPLLQYSAVPSLDKSLKTVDKQIIKVINALNTRDNTTELMVNSFIGNFNKFVTTVGDILSDQSLADKLSAIGVNVIDAVYKVNNSLIDLDMNTLKIEDLEIISKDMEDIETSINTLNDKVDNLPTGGGSEVDLSNFVTKDSYKLLEDRLKILENSGGGEVKMNYFEDIQVPNGTTGEDLKKYCFYIPKDIVYNFENVSILTEWTLSQTDQLIQYHRYLDYSEQDYIDNGITRVSSDGTFKIDTNINTSGYALVKFKRGIYLSEVSVFANGSTNSTSYNAKILFSVDGENYFTNPRIENSTETITPVDINNIEELRQCSAFSVLNTCLTYQHIYNYFKKIDGSLDREIFIAMFIEGTAWVGEKTYNLRLTQQSFKKLEHITYGNSTTANTYNYTLYQTSPTILMVYLKDFVSWGDKRCKLKITY